MNGFIYMAVGGATHPLDARRVAPVIDRIRTQRHTVRQETIITWGGENGDTHVALRGQESLLILSGYLAAIAGDPLALQQSAVAAHILSCFDGAESSDEVAAFCLRLSGSFGICYRNFARHKLICVSDRIGSRPLWIRYRQDGWAVSSHPTALALSLDSHEFDLGAAAGFLLYGNPINPRRSLFSGVEGVAPGTVLELDARGTTCAHRWYRFQHSAEPGRPIGDWVELTAARLTEAASRLLRTCKKPAIFFSGGVDSRLAAAAIREAGGNPLLVTLGDTWNLEVRVARAAAHALGLRHVVIVRDPESYFSSFVRAVYETGGNFLFTHGHFSAACIHAQQQFDTDAFILGDFCEAFSKLLCATDNVGPNMWTPEEFAQKFDAIRLPLYRPCDRIRTLSLFRPGIRSTVEDALRQEIQDRFSDAFDVSNDPLVVADYYLRWESAPTAPTFYMFLDVRATARERNIMFDQGVHCLLETMPAEVRTANLGARVIRCLAPPAARVPNSNTLLPLCWPSRLHSLSRKIKPYLGKLRRRLIGDTHYTTGSWPKLPVLYLTQDAFRHHFQRTLNSGILFDCNMFDPDAVRRSWSAFLDGDLQRAPDVEKLAQLGQTKELLDLGAERYLNQDFTAPLSKRVSAADSSVA